jgi:hypothetical protein
LLIALIFGLAASSALVIGTVVGAYWRPPKPLLAAALAFASGALITALAFDLFQESFKRGGAWLSAVGLLAGAALFGNIIGTGNAAKLFVAYLMGAGFMVFAAVIERVLGVRAEGQSLDTVARPLTAIEEATGSSAAARA